MKNRTQVLEEIRVLPEFDVIVIGGGASGIGAALEAVLRGYRTLLLEKDDFTKGTSSKSTKLIHGGVRYMAQGDLKMVVEALRERGHLLKNAPHLVHNQPFIIPNYKWWEGAFYTIGLKFYDLLAGKQSFGKSLHLGKKAALKLLPGISPKGLKGGVVYHDGQFDDSRLAIDLLKAASKFGGLALNYAEVTGLKKDAKGYISGVYCKDLYNEQEFQADAKTVINATGVWADSILTMDQPEHQKYIRPSQGIHLVLDRKFLPGDYALMIPKTSDGRVLFAVPWHDHLVVGTTDTPINSSEAEPVALEEEINFILNTASAYLDRKVERKDVLSVFAGLRPLAAPKNDSSKTKEISRNHKIIVSDSKLITVIGGKWTTYRKMAQDMIDTAVSKGLLTRSVSRSKFFKLADANKLSEFDSLVIYGNQAAEIEQLWKEDPSLQEKIHPDLPYSWAEVEYICKNEMVVHLEDLLARRLRALLLNARVTSDMAETVARRIAPLLDWSEKRVASEVKSFREIAKNYIL